MSGCTVATVIAKTLEVLITINQSGDITLAGTAHETKATTRYCSCTAPSTIACKLHTVGHTSLPLQPKRLFRWPRKVIRLAQSQLQVAAGLPIPPIQSVLFQHLCVSRQVRMLRPGRGLRVRADSFFHILQELSRHAGGKRQIFPELSPARQDNLALRRRHAT